MVKTKKLRVVMMKFNIRHSNALKFRSNVMGSNKSELMRSIVGEYLVKNK